MENFAMKLTKNDLIGDLQAWAKAYFLHINTLNYSKNTILLYKRVILTFIEYNRAFLDEMGIKDIKTTHIVAYLQFLDEKACKSENRLKNRVSLSKSSKSAYIKVIRSFFAFITENNDENHTFDFAFKKIRIDNSKREEKIVYLNEDEIFRLCEFIERQKGKKRDYNSYRNALLIKLMLHAGLRISEALGVKLKDFKEQDEILRIKIFAKGGKEQNAYIDKAKIDDELDYFSNTAQLSPDELIMKTQHGTALNRTSAFIIINRIYAKALIEKRGLHLLRHTLAMRLTQKGVSVLVIQKILRHSNINTTTIYAKATPQDIANVLVG